MFQIIKLFILALSFNFLNADDAIIDSPELPDASEIPTLSNGHIGFVVNGNAILLNGLYNGQKGESHRARIPNYSNVVPNVDSTSRNYQLNMKQGFFEVTYFATTHRLVQQIYAHRFYNRAIINKIRLIRDAGTSPINVVLQINPGEIPSVDLKETKVTTDELILGKSVTIRCFETNVREDSSAQPLASKVCLAYTNPPSVLLLQVGASDVEYLHITTIGRTENEVRKEIADVITNEENIFETHSTVWEDHWKKFEISVTGNTNLNQIIHASVFYLISNLPSENTNQPKDQFYGLSPGGIGKGGVLYAEYQGHSFWDTEMWMHPPVLLLNPSWSEDILSYRYHVRKAAAVNAKNTGYQGYRYPWESAYTGREVTPDCCPEVVEYQHHVISDIAFAFRSHLAATHDLEWLKTVGCDVAWNTAKFWESRVKFNETTKRYDIRNVMGPDEDHHDIDNNVYTNVNAAINLYFGDFVGCFCKDVLRISDADYEKFHQIARSLTLLYDSVNDYHPQYEGYNGDDIKQADAVLLGYPLQFPMQASTKRNNLLTYDRVTRVNGPAMTWAMHAIGFLDLQDENEAYKVFTRSFEQYTREPFKVWSEVIPGVEGAGNFITAAGGFLQSILNGYGGVRLNFNNLKITNFFVPPNSTSLSFNGVTYLGNRFSLTISGNAATVTLVQIDATKRIKATLKPAGEVYNVDALGWSLTFTRDQELVMEAAEYPFKTCLIKETVIGQEAREPIVPVEQNDWVIGTGKLPDAEELLPTLSNGHVGLVVNGDAILMNGLYNGLKGQSHRARIPNYSNIVASETCSLNNCEHRLNMRHGYFETKLTGGRSFRLVQQTYVHRFYNRAIVNRITLERLESTSDISVALNLHPGEEPGVDVTQVGETRTERVGQHEILIRCFATNDVEDPIYQTTKSPVCTAQTNVPTNLLVAAKNRVAEYLHITTVGRTENEVVKEMRDILVREANADTLFNRHIAAWEDHWETFGISVTGNMNLNQIIHASIFYLISNLPSENTNQPKDQFYGLSPSGIGKGGVLYAEYQGHSFWDTEMWMHPPVLLLNPAWSEDILSYRYHVRKAAADNANNTGYQGYRYPWESAFTGREVTPDCCPEVVEFQHHVMADIAFAFRSHLAATHDLEWLKTVGCDVAWNTAKFWESRVKFNETTKLYDIRNVMGPDEDSWNIDNNVYTNVNAAINLYFGDFVGCACKDVLGISEKDYENFVNIARNLVLLYDSENDYHPQFEKFNGTTTIKQADAVLLGFPLQLPMKASTRRNDLLKYDKLTREDGPAMTWAMHTIGFLDLQDETEAAKLFERSYSLYTREPFKVWTEVIPGVKGAGNFITGAGGFLQSIINGYGGIRLHFDSLTISNFYVLPQAESLIFNGITFLGSRFTLNVTKDEATLTFVDLNTKHPIKATLMPSNTEFYPTVGSTVRFSQRQKLILTARKSPFECEMKETVLGGTATSLKISAILIVVLTIIANII